MTRDDASWSRRNAALAARLDAATADAEDQAARPASSTRSASSTQAASGGPSGNSGPFAGVARSPDSRPPTPDAPFARTAPGAAFARAAQAAHDAHAALAASMAQASPPSPAPAVPKYARHEHERRWLVPATALAEWRSLARPYAHKLSDRYLTCGRLRLRCLTRTDTGEVTYKMTKKYPWSDPLSRPLTTIYLTAEEYAALCVLPARQLAKTRYFVEDQNVMFSVDVFEGPLTGLTIAECECRDAMTLRRIAAPAWVGREITDDLAFTCAALATLPAGSSVPR